MRLADRTLATLWYDIEHNPLGVELSLGESRPIAPGVVHVTAQIRVPLRALTLVRRGELHVGQLELFMASRDARGRRSVPQRFVIPLRLSGKRVPRGHVTEGIELTLREGSTAVALTVFDGLGGTGSYLLRSLALQETRPSPPPAPPS